MNATLIQRLHAHQTFIRGAQRTYEDALRSDLKVGDKVDYIKSPDTYAHAAEIVAWREGDTMLVKHMITGHLRTISLCNILDAARIAQAA